MMVGGRRRPMPCFGTVIQLGRGLIQGSDWLTPVSAELLPAACEVCDVGIHESLDDNLACPQRPAANKAI